MKYKEFERIAIEAGYEIVEHPSSYCMEHKYRNNNISVTKDSINLVFIENEHCTLEDFKVIEAAIELASTPIAEREEERKYYISSKLTPNDDGRFLFKDYDNIDSLVWGDRRCDNNTFTQDEINYIKKKFDTNLNDFNVEEVEKWKLKN